MCVEVVPPALADRVEQLARAQLEAGAAAVDARTASAKAAQAATEVERLLDPIRTLAKLPPQVIAPRPAAPSPHVEDARAYQAGPRSAATPQPAGGAGLVRGAREMLAALARLDDPITAEQLAVLALQSPTGGSFRRYLSELRGRRLVLWDDGHLRASNEGRVVAGDVGGGASAEDLQAAWAKRFVRGARLLLEALVAQYPEPVTLEELAARTGQSAEGGSFRRYMSELQRYGLVEKVAGGRRAIPTLFLEGL